MEYSGGRNEFSNDAQAVDHMRDEVAASLRKLHDLEEQVKLIPMLQVCV